MFKKSMRSSLLYRDNTHPAWLSSPFWTRGRGSSPMALWAPPAPEVPEIQASLSLHEIFGESDGLFANPVFWGLGLSQSAPSTLSKDCIAAGDGEREAHPEGSWTCSEFGDLETAPQAEVCPPVRNVGGWVGLLEMVGSCPALWRGLYQHTDVPSPSLTIQITPNPFGISVLLSPSAGCPVKKKGMEIFDYGLIREDIKSLKDFTDGWYWEPAWLLCCLNLYIPLITEPPQTCFCRWDPSGTPAPAQSLDSP